MNNLCYDYLTFFDLETSGLDPAVHQIAQIAAYHTEDGATFERKLQFSLKRAQPEALEAIHFDLNTWRKESVPQKQGLVEFSEFLEQSAWFEKISKSLKPYHVAVLAGYRIDRFDVPFLMKQFELRNMWCPFELRVFDVFQLVLWMCPGLQDYTLSGVAKYLGVEHENPHEAMSDVMTTYEVAKILLNDLWNGDGPKWTKI